jgi:hypothetical protein
MKALSNGEPSSVALWQPALPGVLASVMCQRFQCSPREKTTSGFVARFDVGIDLMQHKAGQTNVDSLGL